VRLVVSPRNVNLLKTCHAVEKAHSLRTRTVYTRQSTFFIFRN
jgi:hypothetical protein